MNEFFFHNKKDNRNQIAHANASLTTRQIAQWQIHYKWTPKKKNQFGGKLYFGRGGGGENDYILSWE